MKQTCLSFFRDKSKITASLRHTATLLKENQFALLNSGNVLEEDQNTLNVVYYFYIYKNRKRIVL